GHRGWHRAGKPLWTAYQLSYSLCGFAMLRTEGRLARTVQPRPRRRREPQPRAGRQDARLGQSVRCPCAYCHRDRCRSASHRSGHGTSGAWRHGRSRSTGGARSAPAMSLRKLALTLHVIASVGWIGAVASFLALAVTGLVSPDIERVRASYIAMDLTY